MALTGRPWNHALGLHGTKFQMEYFMTEMSHSPVRICGAIGTSKDVYFGNERMMAIYSGVGTLEVFCSRPASLLHAQIPCISLP